MKNKSFILIVLIVFASSGLYAQGSMIIRSGARVTVNGNTFINTWNCGQTLTDTRDGKTYTTVQIGAQCWMAQNLNIGTKLNGVPQTNNDLIEKYCYNFLESNCDIYGGLYQWDEAMQYSTSEGVKGICPAGWHLATDAEWTILTTYLGGESIAGGKMKEAGLTHWSAPNTSATNSSGFTALPAGCDAGYGSFYYLSAGTFYWSSSEYIPTLPWLCYLSYDFEWVSRYATNNTNAFSVRCLKDN